MSKFVFALGASLAIAGLAAPASAETLELQPSSDWKLDQRADTCRASRTFGEGEERVTMWLEQSGKEPSYKFTLIGNPLRNPYGRAIEIKFGDEKENLRSYISAKSSKKRPVIMMFGLAIAPPDIEYGKDVEIEEIGAERENAITAIHLSRSIIDPIKLETGPMHPPLAFLRGCAEQLAITLARTSNSSARGKAKPAELTNARDLPRLIKYPTYLIRAEMDGSVLFRITVNASGKASNCHINRSNRPQLFDNAVCLGMLKHAKFNPALDAEGKPVASYYHSEVTFKLN